MAFASESTAPPNSRLQRTWPALLLQRECATIRVAGHAGEAQVRWAAPVPEVRKISSPRREPWVLSVSEQRTSPGGAKESVAFFAPAGLNDVVERTANPGLTPWATDISPRRGCTDRAAQLAPAAGAARSAAMSQVRYHCASRAAPLRRRIVGRPRYTRYR